MNVFNIERQFKLKKERGWSCLFWAIDLHDVMIKGTYTRLNEGREFCPGAKEVLQWLTKRVDMKLILWTSSHDDALADILAWFVKHDIYFNYVNENPECPTNELCDFDKKFYFNILLDDKAGFECEVDWLTIIAELTRLGEWKCGDSDPPTSLRS